MSLQQYLMQGPETCNTIQICIKHVHKGNGILIQVIIAELGPLIRAVPDEVVGGPIVIVLSVHLSVCPSVHPS